MAETIWLIPALPFAGFVILALAGSRLPKRAAAWIGVGSVGLAAAMALVLGASYYSAPPTGGGWARRCGRG